MSELPESFKPTSESLKNREHAQKINSLGGVIAYIDNLPDTRYTKPEREALKNHVTKLWNDPNNPGAVTSADGTTKPFPQELRSVLSQFTGSLPEPLETFGDQETRVMNIGELPERPFTDARSLHELVDLINQKISKITKTPGLEYILKELNHATDVVEKIEEGELPYAEILKLPQSIRDTVFRIVTNPGTDVSLSRDNNKEKEFGWSIATGLENITEKSMLPLLKVDGNNAGSRTEATLQNIYFSPRQERIKN